MNCRRFRQCLYRLILLKNIIETKVHNESLIMLHAFEQLIINTDEQNQGDTIDVEQASVEMSEGEVAREMDKIK